MIHPLHARLRRLLAGTCTVIPFNQAPQSFQKGFRIHFVKVGRIPSKLFKQFQMSRADDNEDAILAWFRDPIDVCENSQISLVPIGHPSPPFYKLWDRL